MRTMRNSYLLFGTLAFSTLGLIAQQPQQASPAQSYPTPASSAPVNTAPSAKADVGHGAGDIGKGAGGAAGNVAKGTGKGAADVVTLHPVAGAESVGKGV